MLTVVLASKNGSGRLERTLEAFCALKPVPGGWKLICVDNGSTDQTRAHLNAFCSILPMTVLSEPAPGKNRALNRALEEISGDLVVFTDDDVRPHPEWLLMIRKTADRLPDYALLGGKILADWESPPPRWLVDWAPLGHLYSLQDSDVEGPCDAGQIWGPNMAVRSAVFREYGFRFNERIGPDGTASYAMGSEVELNKRLQAAGFKAYYAPPIIVRHRVATATYEPAWILDRAFRLGKGVRLIERALGRRAPRGRASASLMLYRSLSLLSGYSFKNKREFWIQYKTFYWRGYLSD